MTPSSGKLWRVEDFFQDQRIRSENTAAWLDRIERDTDTLKGDFARTRTVQEAQGVASDMGPEFVRNLSSNKLRDMAGNTLPRDVGRSFRNTGLITRFTGKRAQAAVASVWEDERA